MPVMTRYDARVNYSGLTQPKVELDRGGAVKVTVPVVDRILKTVDGMANFDGLETVFAMVPKPDGTWQRQDLRYLNSRYEWPANVTIDTHQLVLPQTSPADLAQVIANGVALGVDTNVGTLWLQTPGDNFKPLP